MSFDPEALRDALLERLRPERLLDSVYRNGLGPRIARLRFVGGGSALAESPRGPFDTAQIIERTRELIQSGTPIAELNAERARTSRIKNGGLLHGCRARRVVTLVLVDVPPDDAALVASGDSAGGWIDSEALRGIDIAPWLERDDTTRQLAERGTLFPPAATQTNLMDLHIVARRL